MNGADNPLAIWPQAASHVAVQADYLILAFTALTLLLNGLLLVQMAGVTLRV